MASKSCVRFSRQNSNSNSGGRRVLADPKDLADSYTRFFMARNATPIQPHDLQPRERPLQIEEVNQAMKRHATPYRLSPDRPKSTDCPGLFLQSDALSKVSHGNAIGDSNTACLSYSLGTAVRISRLESVDCLLLRAKRLASVAIRLKKSIMNESMIDTSFEKMLVPM